ncbi:MAG: efflux RND transporter periplasmic adaptor subunit [Clostridium sp.]|nr:efflux RND transporter periplasmic adaptor subunit [Clostridium sp.]
MRFFRIKSRVALCVAGVLMLCACQHVHEHEEDAKAFHEPTDVHGDEIVFESEKAQAAGVEVRPVCREPFCGVLKVGGRLSAASGQEQTVVATAPGIVEFPIGGLTEGQAVHKGTTLMRLSSAQMLEGRPVDRAREEWDVARRELERMEKLAADRLVTRAELEAARLRCNTARMACEGVETHTVSGKVGVSVPMDGYVKQCLVAQGDYVTEGQPLVVLTQNRRMQLRAEVSESDQSFLSGLDNALFRTSSDSRMYDVRALDGRLVAMGRTLAPGQFYIPVTFEFNNVGDLLPGSYAEVWLQGAVTDSVLVLPVQAITESQGIYYVYVQRDADCYERREVTMGATDGCRVAIRSGLSDGDRVVVNGAVHVKLAASAGLIPEGHNHNH